MIKYYKKRVTPKQGRVVIFENTAEQSINTTDKLVSLLLNWFLEKKS